MISVCSLANQTIISLPLGHDESELASFVCLYRFINKEAKLKLKSLRTQMLDLQRYTQVGTTGSSTVLLWTGKLSTTERGNKSLHFYANCFEDKGNREAFVCVGSIDWPVVLDVVWILWFHEVCGNLWTRKWLLFQLYPVPLENRLGFVNLECAVLTGCDLASYRLEIH